MLNNVPVIALFGASLATALFMLITNEFRFDAEKTGVFIISLVVIWGVKAVLARIHEGDS